MMGLDENGLSSTVGRFGAHDGRGGCNAPGRHPHEPPRLRRVLHRPEPFQNLQRHQPRVLRLPVGPTSSNDFLIF